MVNANRFINMGAIPAVIVAYAVFLLLTNHHQEYPGTEEHIQNIENAGNVHGLLFGGSNAFYSLSAEWLSHYTKLKWYNASIGDEMRNDTMYENFIQGLSARIDRAKVRYVVYSTQIPYSRGQIKHRLNYMRGHGLKAKQSVLGYIRGHFSFDDINHLEYAYPVNGFGDIVFDRVGCYFNGDIIYEREEEDTSVEFLVGRAVFFSSVFPNAAILITLASGYYGELSSGDSTFEQSMREKFYHALSKRSIKNTVVKIVFQPRYSSITQVCDTPWHANEQGRVWRTQNLIESMR